MRYIKIIFLISLFMSVLFFVFVNKKQTSEMEHVARNIASTISFKASNAKAAVNYLQLSATQILSNKDKFNFTPEGNKLINRANLLVLPNSKTDKRYEKEQAAALFLSENLKLVFTQNKKFAWVYYFSKHHFTVVYPPISADDFALNIEMEKEPFFAYATPKYNPNARLFFTPLYTDLIGKGLMITIGKPVYVKGEFLGTVDIDITLNYIDNIFFNLDTLENKSLLYNDKLQIVGSSNLIQDFNRSKIYRADKYLSKELLNADDTEGKVEYIDGNFIFVHKIEGTPFTFIYFQKASLIWLKTLGYVMPFLLFLILFIIIARLYEKSRTVMKKLQEQAIKDYLTGAYNRRYFFDVGVTVFLKAQRKKSPVAVVMLDIDDFKKINDTYGHKAGDVGIMQIKKILDKHLRRSDLFARFGGEEFCILLDDISLKDTEILLEKIRKEFAVNVIVSDKYKFSYTVSFGVAYGMLDSLEEMINLADKALYKSKENGKNSVTVYETH